MSSPNPNPSSSAGPSTPAQSSNLMPPPPRPPQPQARPPTAAHSSSFGQHISDPITIADSDSDDDDGMDSDSDTARPGPSPRNTMHKVRTLQELAEQRVISQLKDAIQGFQATANYACGGTIPISTSVSEEGPAYGSSRRPITTPPIIIRFDTARGGMGKVEFPAPPTRNDEDDDEEEEDGGLKDLLEACTPATFGSGGKGVLGESYRKARKLDRRNFATDFHPHDYGIVDAIKQTLLPGINRPVLGLDGRNACAEHWGVVAELYKLNIYSGPSGKFQKYVDTLRGATQFGSLVVCLPFPHQGGQLKVSHKGHDTVFDWSNSDAKAIKWSAFYSDCKHEVLQVDSGHRITLTYNLYVSEHIGGVLQRYPTVDPSMYPLYEGAKQMLEQPGFMTEGGRVGFFCAHQYAHTRKITEQLMPYALIGIDATVFTVFQALGVKVTVCPVLGEEAFDEYKERVAEKWYEEREEDFEDYETFLATQPEITRVGNKFHKMKMADEQLEGGDDPTPFVNRYWPLQEFVDVIWLNNSTENGWEFAMANIKYGNEASLMWHYSHAAILIDIPPRSERGRPPTRSSDRAVFPPSYSRV